MTEKWIPTHRIMRYGRAYFVMLTDEGAAYTRDEARALDHADFERTPDGTWLFQGQPFKGTVEKLASATTWLELKKEGFLK
jgi:hypothetical protein